MFILGDEGHYHGRFPWVTTALLTMCVATYTVQALVGDSFTNGYSLVPAEITEVRDLTRTEYAKVAVPAGHGNSYAYTSVPIQHYPGPTPIFLTFFTSIFLHGGLAHLLGNMWFLIIFGRNVECALGHARFLAFYLLCGTMAGVAHVLSAPHSVIPCLGASGAISGVMGAYVAIHPFNKVKVLWAKAVFELPALVVIGFWFLMQYISLCLSMDDPGHADHVAYWAHVGGFLTGLLLLWAIVLSLKVRVAAESKAAAFEDRPPAVDPFATFMPPPLVAEKK
jgi:membrane associated rhomboid family serine protease